MPVPLACLQMGAEQSSRGGSHTTIQPQQARKATKSPLPCRRTDHPEFRQVWSLRGSPGSWGNNTIFLHFPPCTRRRSWFPLIAQGQREKAKKNVGYKQRQPLCSFKWSSTQRVCHMVTPLQYPAFYRWDGSQGHLFILKSGQKTTPLSESYVRSTFHESRWFVLLWIMQCLIFIFYQKKKVAPYLRLLLFTIHRLLRLVMEIFMPFLWRRDEKGWPTPPETCEENNVCCDVLASKLPIGEDLVLF